MRLLNLASMMTMIASRLLACLAVGRMWVGVLYPVIRRYRYEARGLSLPKAVGLN